MIIRFCKVSDFIEISYFHPHQGVACSGDRPFDEDENDIWIPRLQRVCAPVRMRVKGAAMQTQSSNPGLIINITLRGVVCMRGGVRGRPGGVTLLLTFTSYDHGL